MFHAYPTYRSVIRVWILISLILLSSCQTIVKQLGVEEQKPTSPDSLQGQSDQDSLIGITDKDPAQSDVLQAAISTGADAILNGINLRRAQEGLLPWIVEPVLVQYAYERSTDMAVRDYLDHLDPQSGEILVQRALQEQGYYGQVAELVYATEDPLSEVSTSTLAAWFDDRDHQAVLFSPDFRYAGLGIMGDGSRWVITLIVVEGRS